MNEFELTVDEFLRRAASDEPTPGGGGVAALAGALGASMVSMVANLTAGRERFRGVEAQVAALRDEAGVLMTDFKNLAHADMRAFARLMDAFRLPRATAAQRAERAGTIREAAREATDVPLVVAEKALRTLELARAIAAVGNPNAVSDAGIAACMAEAAATAALLNVDINLPLVDQDEYRRAGVAARESIQARVAALKVEVLDIVRRRIG